MHSREPNMAVDLSFSIKNLISRIFNMIIAMVGIKPGFVGKAMELIGVLMNGIAQL
jgi:hypothetical protein